MTIDPQALLVAIAVVLVLAVFIIESVFLNALFGIRDALADIARALSRLARRDEPPDWR